MKTAYVNLGCPKNQVDLELILGGLPEASLCDSIEEADAVIINTCAFIEDAKRESIDAVLEAAAVKQRRPELKILVSGCLPQRYREELAKLIPEVDRFFFSTDIRQTVRNIQSCLELPTKEPMRRLLSPLHYAYLRIADGCDNRCAYCAIPLIKGGLRSRPLQEIVDEAKLLAERGTKELLLTAQDITAYGIDRGDAELPLLLEALNEIDGVEWIRLLYTHPAHWNERLIDELASLPKVVHYADIPIQHIADSVLKRMNRRTARADIERLIEKLRSRVPDVALRTTVLVGFPGESEAEFRQLVNFLEEADFAHLGVFTYSHEEETAAYRLPDDVPQRVKKERKEEIEALHMNLVEARNAAFIGRTLRVLADESGSAGSPGLGRSAYQAPEIDGNILLPPNVKPGEFYEVRITDVELFDLYGTPIISGTLAPPAPSNE